MTSILIAALAGIGTGLVIALLVLAVGPWFVRGRG